MSFKDELSVLINRIPGLLGVVLADWEGEAVDHLARMDDFELRVAGAHTSVILNNLRETVRGVQGGGLEEIVITAENARTVVLPITADYFLVLLLKREEPLARALFEARRCMEILRLEIL